MDNMAVLSKLENLQQLLEDNRILRSYAESGCATQTVGQLNEIREKIGSMPKSPSSVSCSVSFPLPANHIAAAKSEKNKRKKLLMAVAAVTALLLWIYFSSHNEALNLWCVLGIFATAGVGWFFKMSSDVYKTKDKELQESQKKYTSSMAVFRKAMSCYEKEVEQGRKEYEQYLIRYYQYYPDFMDTVLGYEEKQYEAEKALEENELRIAECDVAAPEYFHLVPTVVSMLRSGRADSYKEALNLAIEEERQDALEARRREEEDRRLAAMEWQAQEERRHNMMMEQQQREHDRAMEDAAAEAKKAAEKAAEKAERDRRSAGYRKCLNCANHAKCNTYVKENGAGLTCGGYRPL